MIGEHLGVEAGVQANVLRGHGKRYTIFYTLKIKNDPSLELNEVNCRVGHLWKYVTFSVLRADNQIQFESKVVFENVVVNLYLSASYFRRFGYKSTELSETSQMSTLQGIISSNNAPNDYDAKFVEGNDITIAISADVVEDANSAYDTISVDNGFFNWITLSSRREAYNALKKVAGENSSALSGPLGFKDSGSINLSLSSKIEVGIVPSGQLIGCSFLALVKFKTNRKKFLKAGVKVALYSITRSVYYLFLKNLNWGVEHLMGIRKSGVELRGSDLVRKQEVISGDHIRLMRRFDGKNKMIRRSLLYEDVNKNEHGMYFISYQKSLKENFFPLIQKIKDHEDFIVYSHRSNLSQKYRARKIYYKYKGRLKSLKVKNRNLNFVSHQADHFMLVPAKEYLIEMTM